MRTLDTVSLSQIDRKVLALVAGILRANPLVSHVILFGSKARGDARIDSDMDILVLTTRKPSPAEKVELIDSLFDVQLEHEVAISPLIIPADEWEHGLYPAMPLYHEIQDSGVAA